MLRLPVYLYAALTLFISLFTLLYAGLTASKRLYERLISKVVHATMAYFESITTGQLQSLFAKEIDVIDCRLSNSLRSFCLYAFQILAALIVITLNMPVFLAVAFPLAICYIHLLKKSLDISRRLKRLDSKRHAFIYSHFTESLTGLRTVRAFGKENDFMQRCEQLIDDFARVRDANFVCGRWLGLRLELIGSLTVLAIAMIVAVSHNFTQLAVNGSLAGLSLSYAMNITELLNAIVRQANELDNDIVSIERLASADREQSKEQEAEWLLPNDHYLALTGWPKEGTLGFSHYSTRYGRNEQKSQQLALSDINLYIKAGEKISVMGRTGSGKSTLILSLMRILERSEGRITLDGVDVALVGLHTLRNTIAVVPQDPFIRNSSIRNNLDLFGRHTDSRLWEVLELCGLKELATTVEGLSTNVCDAGGDDRNCGGVVLSCGQAQLLALARILLNPKQIVLLDEATSILDPSTEELFERVLNRELHSTTIITITHRAAISPTSTSVVTVTNGNLLCEPSRINIA